MSKKKLLFVNNNLEIGGVQTSLINLLTEIKDIYDVTLLVFADRPEYRQRLPEGVKMITVKSPYRHFGSSSSQVRSNKSEYLSRSFWVLLSRLFGRRFVTRLMGIFQPKIKGYDVAVSYLHDHPQKLFYGGANEFVIDKTDAKKKIGWLHCDFKLSGANNPTGRRLYRKFDTVIGCSQGTVSTFTSVMPEMKNKTCSVRNFNNYDYIRKSAGEGVFDTFNGVKLVTVARLSPEKGIHRALNAVKHCLDNRVSVDYTIVGSGKSENDLRDLVLQLGIEDHVHFLGNQNNPYKFIKGKDLLLLTSYHEAAPMVFDEAMALAVPTFATKTVSTDEMLLKTGGGFVVENDDSAIINGLLSLCKDPSVIEERKKLLSSINFSNKDNLEAFIKAIEK